MKQHPTMDTLLDYLEDAENVKFTDMRLHIATCVVCRNQLQRLSSLQQSIKHSGPLQNRLAETSSQLTSALDQHSIERYIDGELDDAQSASIQQLLDSDPGALKAALHYASHSAASDHLRKGTESPANMAGSDAQIKIDSPSNGFIEQLKKFFDFRPPVWISVPATAAVVLVMMLAIMPDWKSSPSQGFTVAAYQDKAVIHYQGDNQLPGIGFFNKAHRSTEAFGPMIIRYTDHQDLLLRWPQVPNAQQYHLALYLISEGQKITVHEMDLKANQTTIADFKADAGKRYEWTLNGKTSDAKSFYATGGFVINKQQ